MQIRTCSATSLPKLMEEMGRTYGQDAVLLSVRRIEATGTSPLRIEGTIGVRNDFDAPPPQRAESKPAPRKNDSWHDAEMPLFPVRKKSLRFDTNRILPGSVLVGPPGSGKTTTAAKIAGRLSTLTRGDVGMISTDTVRPGGAALMMAYADKLDVYSTSVMSAPDLHRRTAQWNKRGALVIDTCGFNPTNILAIKELTSWLDNVKTEVCRLLILSATDNLAIIRECLNLYDELKIAGVVVTKTDLDASGGECISEVQRQKRPLAFLGTGTEVPGDLVVPEEQYQTLGEAMSLQR